MENQTEKDMETETLTVPHKAYPGKHLQQTGSNLTGCRSEACRVQSVGVEVNDLRPGAV